MCVNQIKLWNNSVLSNTNKNLIIYNTNDSTPTYIHSIYLHLSSAIQSGLWLVVARDSNFEAHLKINHYRKQYAKQVKLSSTQIFPSQLQARHDRRVCSWEIFGFKKILTRNFHTISREHNWRSVHHENSSSRWRSCTTGNLGKINFMLWIMFLVSEYIQIWR